MLTGSAQGTIEVGQNPSAGAPCASRIVQLSSATIEMVEQPIVSRIGPRCLVSFALLRIRDLVRDEG